MAAAATIRFEQAAIVIEVAGQRRKVAINKFPFTVGRSDEADASIADFRVSRLHARLVQQDGKYFIEDTGSRHGTFVNGARCERQQIRNKDEITLGVPGLRITFELAEPSSNATMLFSRIATDSDSSELEKLRLFLEAARSLAGGGVVVDVLRNMLDYALRITKAERGFVYLRDAHRAPVLSCGLDSKGQQLASDAGVSHSVIEEALDSAAEFITGDASQLSGLAERQSILMNELRTIIAIPLRAQRMGGGQGVTPETQGVLYLDSHMTARNLSGASPEVLRALASECAAVLENARLMEAEEAARHYRQELEIAASIQRSLISKGEVQCDFASLRGRSIPCKEVGGDFFDVHVAPDAVTVVVVDVSGKGISAALLAAVIHGMFYAQISSGASLVDAVYSVNNFLCGRVGGQKYATLMAAQLERNGTLHLVNCGHVPAIVAENGAVSRVEEGDMPVGLIAETGFHALHRQLAPGARVCIMTDGVSETANAADEEFGMEGVEPHLLSADPIAGILEAVDQFCGGAEPQDDRTLVVLERTQ